jgi:hypothetical protein
LDHLGRFAPPLQGFRHGPAAGSGLPLDGVGSLKVDMKRLSARSCCVAERHAGLDDDEARRAILELRQRVEVLSEQQKSEQTTQ